MSTITGPGWYGLRVLIIAVLFGMTITRPLAIGDGESYTRSISEMASTPDGLVQLMMMGVLAHDLTLLETSIAHEVNINATTAQGETALFIAASLGHIDIIQMLLQYSPHLEIDKVNAEHRTPLMAAVISGHTEIVSLLLNAGADPDRTVSTQEVDSPSARQMALLSDDPDMIALFDPQAAEALRQKHELTLSTLALFEGAVDGDPALIETSLSTLEYFGNPSAVTDENGWTPLMHAAANGHIDVVRLLIDAGFDVNRRMGREQLTPLMAATANEDVHMVELLIRSGADPAIKQRDGMTALDIAKAIGAPPAVFDVLGNTLVPLDPLTAVRNDDITPLLALLDMGKLKPQLRDDQGWTFMMHAADSNSLRAAAILLDEYGRKQTQYTTHDDQSALTIAIARGHDKMVNLLINHGAPVEQKIRGKLSLDAFAETRKQPVMAKRLKQAIRTQTLKLQQELLLAGYEVGRPDGIAGEMTERALNEFKRSNKNITTYADAIWTSPALTDTPR